MKLPMMHRAQAAPCRRRWGVVGGVLSGDVSLVPDNVKKSEPVRGDLHQMHIRGVFWVLPFRFRS